MSDSFNLRVPPDMREALERATAELIARTHEVITVQDYIRGLLRDHLQQVDPLYAHLIEEPAHVAD